MFLLETCYALEKSKGVYCIFKIQNGFMAIRVAYFEVEHLVLLLQKQN
jgi:hypothetical protein